MLVSLELLLRSLKAASPLGSHVDVVNGLSLHHTDIFGDSKGQRHTVVLAGYFLWPSQLFDPCCAAHSCATARGSIAMQ